MNFTALLVQPSAPDAAPAAPAPGENPGSSSPGGGGLFGGLGSLIWLLPLVFVFFMMRNQTKKQKEIEANIKIGDRVHTRGGVIGKVVKLADRHVDLEIAPGVFVSFRKDAIEGLDVDPKKEAEKKDAEKKESDAKAKKDDAKKDDAKKDDAKALSSGKGKDDKAKDAAKEKA